MYEGPIERQQKPESTLSGFFLSLLLYCSFACSQPLSGLVEELVWERGALPLPSPGSDTIWTEATVDALYHDLHHYRLRDTGASGDAIEESATTSPWLKCAISCNRKTWGSKAEGNMGAIRSDWSGDPQGYVIASRSALNAGFISGWKEFGCLFFSGSLGYAMNGQSSTARSESGSPVDKALELFDNSGAMYGLRTGISFPGVRLSLYGKKQPFPVIKSRIEKRSNRSFIDLSLASSHRESGIDAAFLTGRDTCTMGVALLSLRSDTGAAGTDQLPLSLDGGGFRYRVAITAQSIPWSTSLCFSSTLIGFQARGHDAKGSLFFNLDSNWFSHTRFEGSMTPTHRMAIGLFGESVACDNAVHGSFDPYLFSSFSMFDPVKYRIDTLRFNYRAGGAFLKRIFFFRNSGRIDATLHASIVRIDGSMSTREYDFTYIIPRLINRRTLEFIDETRLILTPEIRYTVRWRRFSCAASARQLVPLDISLPEGTGGTAAGPTNRTVRGGTTFGITAGFRS